MDLESSSALVEAETSIPVEVWDPNNESEFFYCRVRGPGTGACVQNENSSISLGSEVFSHFGAEVSVPYQNRPPALFRSLKVLV